MRGSHARRTRFAKKARSTTDEDMLARRNSSHAMRSEPDKKRQQTLASVQIDSSCCRSAQDMIAARKGLRSYASCLSPLASERRYSLGLAGCWNERNGIHVKKIRTRSNRATSSTKMTGNLWPSPSKAPCHEGDDISWRLVRLRGIKGKVNSAKLLPRFQTLTGARGRSGLRFGLALQT